MADNDPVFPSFLQNYSTLKTHFDEQFTDRLPHEIGRRFSDFAERLIPHTLFGKLCGQPDRQQTSHDGGVDFISESDDASTRLYTQVKYSIKDISAIDSIFSKFQNFYNIQSNELQQLSLFPDINGATNTVQTPRFQIITMHDLSRLIPKYQESRLAGVSFFKQLLRTESIEIVDGNTIFRMLRTNFMKSSIVPASFELDFASPFIAMRNVTIGVINNHSLINLYDAYGDSLFFENLRDFLNSTEVNEAISLTVRDRPDQLLSLNNGIVFKARHVQRIDEKRIKLEDASLVNGCQTTIAIVRNSSKECHVIVKVVEASPEESWDITRAANFQNQVKRFDLDLAEFLRPQVVKKMATEHGLSYAGKDAFRILDAIYDDEVVYDELRYLFIGVFSKQPNNIFDTEYTQILPQVLKQFFHSDQSASLLFEQMFQIFMSSNRLAKKLREAKKRSVIYRRFFANNKTAYRAFFTLLALSAATNIDISAENTSLSDSDRYDMIHEFLNKSSDLVNTNETEFIRYYKITLQVVSATTAKTRDKHEIQQYLWKYMRQTGFSVFLERIKQQAAFDEDLADI